MRTIEEILKQIKNPKISEDERFELIELYAGSVNISEDILNLAQIINEEENSILRHEISAQLLKINIRQPSLMEPIIEEIEDILINISMNDSSIVSRHEAIESLSSIGGRKSSDFLSNLSLIENNKDILDTIKISLPIIKKRLQRNDKAINNKSLAISNAK